MSYTGIAELPADVLDEDGRPVILLSPIETSDHGLPAVAEAGQVAGIKVFRTGAVKDSKGRRRVWERADLDRMVANFALLRDRGLLPNVPVRENHSRDVRQIGGYITALNVRPGDDGRFYLEADLDLTEPVVRDRYHRGTYRNRSIEIGTYETNDGEVYFPVVLGLAFCDIPAVEGLYEAALSAYETEQAPKIMVYAPDQSADAPGNAATKTAVSFDTILGDLATLAKESKNDDVSAAVQQVIQAVEAIKGATTPSPGTPAPTHAQGEQMSDTFSFTLDGTVCEITGDAKTEMLFTTLLAQRDALATENAEYQKTIKEAASAAREAAVDRWLSEKRITPAQLVDMKAHVQTLTDEQFRAHEALITSTPVLAFTQEHGDGDPEGQQPQDSVVKNHTQTLNMLRFTGMSPDRLRETRPYKALVALGVTPNLEV